jgi:hypothetical protein
MSPAQLARRNRSNLEAMFIALVALLLAVAAFAVAGQLADDDDGSALDAGTGNESAAPREAELALSSADEGEHEHSGSGEEGHSHESGDASHDDGHASGTHDDNHASGTHDDNHSSGTHDDNHAGGTHDDNHSSGTHDDNDDGHGSHTTTPGDTTAGHDDGHNHGPTIPGQTTVPHDDGHNHGTPPTTTADSDDTTPTTHDHGTVTTVPGDTTPTTTHDHTDGPNVQLADLPPDLRTTIVNATNSILQYNTPAKASAAGWQRLTKYFPGIAAHFGNLGWVIDTTSVFDPTKVDILLFGKGPEAPLVGINYILYSPDGPPEGFPGDLDGWHRHANLCLLNGVIVGEAPDGGSCPDGQTEIYFGDYWLLHVWSIAGWESPEGIFSHYNSRV